MASISPKKTITFFYISMASYIQQMRPFFSGKNFVYDVCLPLKHQAKFVAKDILKFHFSFIFQRKQVIPASTQCWRHWINAESMHFNIVCPLGWHSMWIILYSLKNLKKQQQQQKKNPSFIYCSCYWCLTLKMPRKHASENVACLCRLLHLLANFSNILFAYRQTVWTQIRLLLEEIRLLLDPDQTAPGPRSDCS